MASVDTLDTTSRSVIHRSRELAGVFRERLAAELATGGARFPRENVDELIAAGFLLLPAPATAGGSGLTLETYCAVTEELAVGSPATALLLTMPVGFTAIFDLPDEHIPDDHRRAWREQRDWIYAEASAGHVFAAGNSEPGVSVIQQTKTVAAQVNGAWRLNGRKVFGSWGQYSHWLFSSARLADEPIVEFFLVPTREAGVRWASDWNSLGMSETESHSFELCDAPATAIVGYPGLFDLVNRGFWWNLAFAAVALGCVRGLLEPLLRGSGALGPAARSDLAALTARYEAARGYLMDTARRHTPLTTPRDAALKVRTKTHVTRECVALASELFALGSGSALAANGLAGKYLRDVFAGTGLRPPLKATLDSWGDGLDDWEAQT